MADPRDDHMVDPFRRVLPPLTREDPDRRPSGLLGAPGRRGHYFAAAACDDRAPTLREQTADFLRRALVLRAAPDHRDLNGHVRDATRHGGSGSTGRETDRRRRLRRLLRRAQARPPRSDDRQPRELHALHADAARGSLRHARAETRRRPAARDVSLRRPCPRPRPRPRRQSQTLTGRDRGTNLLDPLRRPGLLARLGRPQATLGRYKGIASVFGIPLKGFPGWWVTRTYHLYQLPLLSRKLRVVTDWTVALLFPRDIAELGQLEQPRKLGD